jgi:hypothetical protein
VHPVAGVREPDEVGVGENCSEMKNKIKKIVETNVLRTIIQGYRENKNGEY